MEVSQTTNDSRVRQWRKPLGQTTPPPKRFKVDILADRCKGCRFCIEFCPRGVLRESPDFNRKGYHPACAPDCSECLNCGYCELICPEFAVRVTPVEEHE